MTGGRRPAEYDEPGPSWRAPPPPPPSAEERNTFVALQRFKLAMRFRRKTNHALQRLGISFAQWRVLEATWRLIRQTGDAVSHLDVSRELDLDEASVSRLMHVLSKRGWVSHGPDLRFYAWRVFLHDEGKWLVSAGYELVASVHASCTWGG